MLACHVLPEYEHVFRQYVAMRPVRLVDWPALPVSAGGVGVPAGGGGGLESRGAPDNARDATDTGAQVSEETAALNFQELLLDHTVLHSLSVMFPLSPHYTLAFLKRFIALVEESGVEVSERLLTTYVDLLLKTPRRPEEGGPPLSPCYRTYCLTAPGRGYPVAERKPRTVDAMVLKESQLSVERGTTGLVTWKAALRLSEHILLNPFVVKGKRVLELGSGMGLAGFVCSYAGAKNVRLTDVHPAVIHGLRENAKINGFLSAPPPDHLPAVDVAALDWFDCTDDDLGGSAEAADVVIAADVVYDPTVVGALADVLARTLRLGRSEQWEERRALVASTVRNRDTQEMFLRALDAKGVLCKEVETRRPAACRFFDTESSDVLILELTVAAQCGAPTTPCGT
ncbi:MAG: hypothetical protein BJ554DRAFT_8277 [Olpidium bornovanus]|uniref:FAM86 N-terminal domain-containing protein n=1 Tax=Olpidium bornovanus TaxID=278681 RepID=A0A8H7ZV65_9FUNG|nr:MAG: hypothetical protein BJ554DRAFT_8277 [Olpidium bornovanus]